MNKILMVLFLLMLVCFSDVFTQHKSKLENESLRGLKGVYVLIEVLDPDTEEDGLRKSQIQTDVELKLRLAGIKVLTEEERFKETGAPFLYVAINILRRDSGLSYVFFTNVSFQQLVCLVRNKNIYVFAKTWDEGVLGHGGIGNIANFIRDSVKDKVDIFINDYLSVNPK